MNKIKLLLFLVFLSIISVAVAQKVKPVFKKFTFVSYRPTLSGGKESIRVEDYIEINSDGAFHKMLMRYKDYYGNHLSYESKMWDTIYRTPDIVLITMNNVFACGKELNHQGEFKKPSADSFFAGPYNFISYTDDHNVTHNFIMAGESDVDDKVLSALELLWHLPFAWNTQTSNLHRDLALEARILKYHNACKNLPKIQEPPRVELPGN